MPADDLGSFKELAMQLAEDLHDVVLTDQVSVSSSCSHSAKLTPIFTGSIRRCRQRQAHVATQRAYHDELGQGEQVLSSLLLNID